MKMQKILFVLGGVALGIALLMYLFEDQMTRILGYSEYSTYGFAPGIGANFLIVELALFVFGLICLGLGVVQRKEK